MINKLQQEMIAAMKAHNKLRKETLSSLIGAVKKTAIDKKCKDNITDELVNEVILKELKTVNEMIDTCPKERIELFAEYSEKLNIINEFAPKLIVDEQEIMEVIATLLSNAKIELIKNNKGQIMKTVMPKLKGKADMKIVNTVITNLLK